MGESSIARLEAHRRLAVERATSALAAAKQVACERERAWQHALAEAARCDEALRAARAQFAAARTIDALHGAARRIQVADGALVAQRARLSRAERAYCEAARMFTACMDQVREAELARRAVARMRTRAEAARALVVERHLEDDDDDLVRARFVR